MTVAKKADVVEKAETKDKAADEKPKETTVEFLASLAAVLVTGLFIITFVMQAFEIPSSSMEDTLLIGDHVFVNRIQFAPKTSWVGPLFPYRDPKPGEIVVFLHPDLQRFAGMFVVKRVIGVPGDRIHLRNGVVYRNGQALNEPYVLHDQDHPSDFYRNSFPTVSPSNEDDLSADWSTDLASHIQGEDLVVPPNSFFAMGDHRGVSMDSRYWGFIPRSNLIGRPMFIYWSFETPEGQYTKTSWGERVTFFAKIVIHFFDRTRWKRTLTVVR